MALRQDGFGKSNRIMPKVNVDKPKSDDEEDEEEDQYVEANNKNNNIQQFKQVELSLEGLKSKKHEQLKNKPDLIKLLHEIDDYQIFVPDSVVKYHLERAGCNIDPNDRKIVRIIGLAAQKFATTIAENALEYNITSAGKNSKITNGNRTLTLSDISKAAADEDIKIHNSKRPRLR